jgi:hypothetical protein
MSPGRFKLTEVTFARLSWDLDNESSDDEAASLCGSNTASRLPLIVGSSQGLHLCRSQVLGSQDLTRILSILRGGLPNDGTDPIGLPLKLGMAAALIDRGLAY